MSNELINFTFKSGNTAQLSKEDIQELHENLFENEKMAEYFEIFKLCNDGIIISDHILEIGEPTEKTLGYLKLGLDDELINAMANQAKDGTGEPITLMMLSFRNTKLPSDIKLEFTE